MATIKTAVGVPAEVFEAAEKLARQLNTSRSRLYTMALEDLIRRHRNRELLEQINVAYSDYPDEEERRLIRAAKNQAARILEKEDW